MVSWAVRVMMFVYIFTTVLALMHTPTFNIWDKYYSSPNMYFNKTNMSVSTMTQTQADMYYGRDSNVTVNNSFTFTSISNMNDAGVLGWLVAVFTLIIQIFFFLLYGFTAAWWFIGTFIVQQFGYAFTPIAVLLQGGLDIMYTYIVLQFLMGRGGKVYD